MEMAPSLRQLATLGEEFAQVRARFAALESRVSDAEWLRPPRPEAWSVAQCVQHLNLTAAAMLPRIRAAVTAARELPPIGDRAYRGALLGRVLAAMLGPAPKLMGITLGRSKTAAAFVPGAELPRSRTVSEFRHWNTEGAAMVSEAEGLQLDRCTIESPFVKGTRYDAYSALWILVRHEHRHLVQAERALAALKEAP